jgi:hypothetical protein
MQFLSNNPYAVSTPKGSGEQETNATSSKEKIVAPGRCRSKGLKPTVFTPF